jgi:hypothetical protein
MKVVNSEDIVISKFAFRLDLMAAGYHYHSNYCFECFSRVHVFYKRKLNVNRKGKCPFCSAIMSLTSVSPHIL